MSFSGRVFLETYCKHMWNPTVKQPVGCIIFFASARHFDDGKPPQKAIGHESINPHRLFVVVFSFVFYPPKGSLVFCNPPMGSLMQKFAGVSPGGLGVPGHRYLQSSGRGPVGATHRERAVRAEAFRRLAA